MILGYSVYELLWLFFIYAFLGWCIEVGFCGLEIGKFVNRGFLNGPLCPIYGVGAVIVILCLTPISHNAVLLFFCAAVLTSVLELVTAFVLDKMFHARWWDYSDKPFNIGGYICLKFSVYWGLVCIALMRGIHPVIYDVIKLVPFVLGIILLVFFSAVFVCDVVITVITIKKLSHRLGIMDELAQKIHNISDEIGSHVYEGVSAAAKKGEEIFNSEQLEELREKHRKELEELKEKYSSVTKENHFFQKRIIKACPIMRSHRHSEQLDKLKAKFKK